MDVRIGIIQSPREITFEIDGTADEVLQAITEADDFVRFADVKGQSFLVNVDQIAYVEVGAETRRVGFVS